MSEGRLPKPRTAHEVQLDIVAIGGLIEWKPLCPPFRGDGNYEETVEVGPLIPDEMWAFWDEPDDDDCPHYDGPQSDAWHAARARDGRFEARLARGE